MASYSKAFRQVPAAGAGVPCNDFIIKVDGGSGTPVLASGGDRSKQVKSITDNGSGDHSIDLNYKYQAIEFVAYRVDGAAQTVSAISYDTTNNQIDVTLSADTAGTIFIACRGFISNQNV